jgi:DNA polymerase elongation subunit (family B)
MYQNIYIDKKNEIVHLWDDEKGYLQFKMPKYAYRKKAGGRYRSVYGDELEKVTFFNRNDPSVFEGDVPPETRVLIDAYEKSDEPSKGHRILFFDIEVDSEGGFPIVEEGDKAITAIALYDSTTKKYTALILDKEQKLQDYENDDTIVLSFADEESLISTFMTKWEEIQPTIVTGWNIDGFDVPYLYNRIKRVMGGSYAKRLSPIQECYYNTFSKRMVVAGVSCLDYLTLYQKFSGKNEPTYALGAIGKKVVNMEKITYHGSLNDLYKSDLKKYIDYNLNDVKIVVAIDKKTQFIDLARSICHTGHVGYEQFGTSSRYLEGAILMYLRRKGRVAPNKPIEGREEYEQRLEEGEEGFEGAYVKSPVPGRYEWVYDLDLTSMYPNIIISLNISPETKVGVINKIEYDDCYLSERKNELTDAYENLSDTAKKATPLEEYLDQRLYLYNARMFSQGKVSKYYVGSITYTHDELVQLLTQSNMSIASNGAIYKLPADVGQEGTIPSILIKWFNERKEMRKLASKFHNEGNHEMYEFYDLRQKVQKILLNSIYGCLGLPVFRFYDKDNAEAVTLTGVDIIKTANRSINQYYRGVLKEQGGNDYVIYVDTDSCFASALPIIQQTMPEVDLNDEKQMTDAILKVTGDAQKYVNTMFGVMAKKLFNVERHRFDAKQEVIAKTSFWLAKKRYCQFIINKGGLVCDEMEVKGIDVVRTSFPPQFRKFMGEILNDLLKKVERETVDKKILDFKASLKTLKMFDIAKNTSVKFQSQDKKKDYNPKSRQPFQILTGTPAQVKAALVYNDLLTKFGLTKIVPPIFHGQKIKWVYLKQNEYGVECMAMKADGTDPQQIIDFIDKYIDRDAMYEQELKSKLIEFYNVLNWEYPNENSAVASEFFDF